MNSLAEDNYNDADTYRRARRAQDRSQRQLEHHAHAHGPEAEGRTASTRERVGRAVGDLEVAHWHPENSDDQWTQAALTVEGKLSNFDITFASSYLKRDVDTNSDYSDYAFFYDTLDGYGAYFYDNAGDLINPSQYINGKDGYTKTSHELRFSTSAENRCALRRRPVLPAPDARHPAGLQDHRAQRRQRRHRLGRHVLADQAVARGPRLRGVRRGHVRRHRQARAHRRLRVTSSTRTRSRASSASASPIRTARAPAKASCFDTGQVFETAPCTNLDKTVKDERHHVHASTPRSTSPTT